MKRLNKVLMIGVLLTSMLVLGACGNSQKQDDKQSSSDKKHIKLLMSQDHKLTLLQHG